MTDWHPGQWWPKSEASVAVSWSVSTVFSWSTSIAYSSVSAPVRIANEWSTAFADWGQVASYINLSSVSLDLATGSSSAITTTNTIVVVPTALTRSELDVLAGELTTDDKAFIVRAGDVTPEEGGTLTIGSNVWMILTWRTSADGLTHRLITRRAG